MNNLGFEREPFLMAPDGLPPGQVEKKGSILGGILRLRSLVGVDVQHQTLPDASDHEIIDNGDSGNYLGEKSDYGFLTPELGVTIADLTEQRQAHSSLVRSFIEDSENLGLIDRVITDIHFGGDKGQRKDRRRQVVEAKRDVKELGLVYSSISQLSAIEEQYADGSSHSQVVEELRAKKLQMLGGTKQTPELQEFRSRLSQFEISVKEIFGRVAQLEGFIEGELLEYVKQGPAQALEVLDFVIASTDSEAQIDISLGNLLANNCLLNGADSVIAEAERILASARNTGKMTKTYTTQRLEEDGGENELAFFAKIFKQRTGEDSLISEISERFDDWPPDMKRAYESFVDNAIQSRSGQLSRAKETMIRRSWLPPDTDTLTRTIEAFISRHRNFGLRNGQKRPNGIGRNGSRGRRSPTSLSGFETLEMSGEVQAEPMPLGVLVKGNGHDTKLNLVPDQEGAHQAIARELIDRKIVNSDPEYVREMAECIKALALDPRNPRAVRSFNSGASVSINGKFRRLYRADARRLGPNVRERGQASRIVFCIVERKVAIYRIFHRHDDYVRFADSFDG